jgi:DNA sulfur modification protein DndB
MNLSHEGLSSLIQDDQQLRAEARQRKEEFDVTSIYPEDEEKFAAKGWALLSSGVSKLKLKRAKTHDALLEDRVWSLLYKLG